MRIWISLTASTNAFKDVPGVLRTGDAVLTSQRISARGLGILRSTRESE